MTSLLPSSATRTSAREESAETGPARRRSRSLVLVATLGGGAAAAVTLGVCLLLGLAGWYLTDGGGHGAPRDGLHVGALAWLLGHGSGVGVGGVAVTVVPLGITLLCALALWRAGLRIGVAVSGHGPDVDGLTDGQRDLVVPLAGALLTAGYVVVALGVATLAAAPATRAGPATAPDSSAVVLWSLLLCLLAGVPAIAVGSGRAALWASWLPATVVASALVARRVLVWWSIVAFLALAAALAVDLDTAANVMGSLGGESSSGGGALVVMLLVSLVLLPNAAAFASSYLLGPGFAVGTGTAVTPSLVVLGPLPAFPLLAALPDAGTASGWTRWVVLLPVLVAGLATMRAQRAWPTPYYVEGAVRGLAGGVAAGVALAAVTGLAGGAVGPGRMRDVAPETFESLLHAVTGFGLGGLLGGLLVTWWQRRTMPVEVTLED